MSVKVVTKGGENIVAEAKQKIGNLTYT
ncbi:MAG: hypothetical protein JWQ09_1994, partial [Segetibacter sp.]|nr:hypothetical protein [Segetibacter sp.]